MYSARYSCRILMKLEFSWQIFEKFSKIKCREYPSIGSRAVWYAGRQTENTQTDRHDEANSRFAQFYESA